MYSFVLNKCCSTFVHAEFLETNNTFYIYFSNLQFYTDNLRNCLSNSIIHFQIILSLWLVMYLYIYLPAFCYPVVTRWAWHNDATEEQPYNVGWLIDGVSVIEGATYQVTQTLVKALVKAQLNWIVFVKMFFNWWKHCTVIIVVTRSFKQIAIT